MLGFLAAVFVLSCRADACSLPVFRYSLERWPADPYHIFIYHRGPLADRDKALAEGMRRLAEAPPFANIRVATIDLESQPDPLAVKGAPQRAMPRLPWMTVLFPGIPGRVPEVWSGPLTRDNVEAVLDSPARREIARRIQSGESAVWVLLECGDPVVDERASAILERTLKKMEKELAIPPQDAEALALLSRGGPQMRVAFSLLRVSRSDPSERFLVMSLLGSEPDLDELRGPMAFPVFGRGRLLYALVENGINEANIAEACFFLVGPCLCEVKAEHPGTELLIAFDWDGFLAGEAAPNTPLRIPGMAQFDAATGDFKGPRVAKQSAPIYKGLALGIGALLAIVIIGMALLARGAMNGRRR